MTIDTMDKGQRRRTGDVADRLFEAIGGDILNGLLPPNAKLSEPKLSVKYGTSRAPVREALRRLQERGLVVRTPNAGVRVVSFSPQNFLDLLSVREALEGMAARLAARNATDADLEKLRLVVQDRASRHAAATPTEDPYRTLEGDFHYLIALASKNPPLIRTLCDDLFHVFRLCRRQHLKLPSRGRAAVEEHIRILDALEHRDEDLAEILMRRHIASARKAFEASLAEATVALV